MNFLKSFIFPLKMRRFRTMSVLIAIVIFMASTYLAIVPIKYKHSKPNNVIKTNAYLTKDYQDATTDFDYSEIKNKNYVIEKDLTLSAGVRTTSVYTVDSIVNNVNYKFYFVFDFDNDGFSSTADLYEKYNLVKEKNSAILLFTTKYYELQNTKEETVNDVANITFNTIQGSTYQDCNLDFASFNNTNEFLDGISLMLAKLYGTMYVSAFTLTSALMMFILPLVLVLVMWLILRKKGTLITLKEYYNIASICTIIPTLIAFGVAWFWPQVVNFYTTAFVVYYLFVIYRINAFPIDYEEKKTVKNDAFKPVEVEAVEEIQKVEDTTNNTQD